MRLGQVPTLKVSRDMEEKEAATPRPPQSVSGQGRHKDSQSGPGTLWVTLLTTLGKCILGKEGWRGESLGKGVGAVSISA